MEAFYFDIYSIGKEDAKTKVHTELDDGGKKT